MVAAAFDDRLLGAPVVTGGGGVGAYRFAGPRGSETLDLMETKYPNWFGAPDRLGVHFAPHGHAFTPDDWTAMLDCFDTHRRGKPADRRFDRFPTEEELDAALQRPTGR